MGRQVKGMEIKNLCKSFGETAVLTDFSAVFPPGQTTCIMGPSGCGKTTLLRILMGLEQADNGEISGLPSKIAAVFQEDRLLPAFSAGRNAALAARKLSEEELQGHFAAVGLENCLHTPVKELSGGMQRRVAILRAVLAESDLLLLDEPFKGLDAETKTRVMAYLKKHTAGKTVLLVTHSQEEAAPMGGNCIRMKE